MKLTGHRFQVFQFSLLCQTPIAPGDTPMVLMIHISFEANTSLNNQQRLIDLYCFPPQFHRTLIDAKKHLDKSLLPSYLNGTNDSMELSNGFHKLVREAEDELALLDEMEIDITKYSALWNQNHPTTGGCGKESEIESGMVGSFRKLNID